MHVQTTSKTLLRDIGADARSPRWAEFVARYRPMMLSYLSSRWPTLSDEADDIVQETLLALVRILPGYRYDPGEKGAFHNYLTGILRNKAAMAMRRRRGGEALDAAAADALAAGAGDGVGAEEAARRDAVFEIALRQLLADDTIRERTKQAFVRTAVKGEPPAEVARDLGVEPNAVSQMKSRMVRRMREIVSALESGLA